MVQDGSLKPTIFVYACCITVLVVWRMYLSVKEKHHVH